MPSTIQIVATIDQSQVDRVAKSLRAVPFGIERAISSSINGALAHGRTIISRRIRAEVNISQKAVLRAIVLRKAGKGDRDGSIVISRQPIALSEYKPVQTKTGVRVQVRRSRGPEIIPHSFLATVRSGHIGVFVRKMGENGKRAGRLPIRQLYGPTAVGILAGSPGMLSGVQAEMGAECAKRLDGQVARFIANPE